MGFYSVKVFDAGLHDQRTLTKFLMEYFDHVNRPLDLQLSVQSVPITTKIVSSNPIHGEVYSMPPYVIKFVIDFRLGNGFL